MNEETASWALPLVAPGQAQKEMTVNAAMARVDMLVQAAVKAVGVDAPPADPDPGDAWIVGDAPEGAWAGQAGALAGWTAAGWLFVAPRDGLRVWNAVDGTVATFARGVWRPGRLKGTTLFIDNIQVVGAQQPAITTPVGGAAVDAEARGAIGAILNALRTHGLIAS